LPEDKMYALSPEIFETIEKGLKELDVKDTDTFADIFRVQSDFMKEIGDSRNFVNPKTEAKKIKDILRYNKFVDEINPILASSRAMDTLGSSAILRGDPANDVRKLGVKEFTIDPEDIQAITGRSYKESLDKTPEEIFYMLDETGKKQKYVDVPNNPEALSQAYFKDLYKDDSAIANLKNGALILKKAVVPKMDFSGKFKIDPYFEKSTSNEMKLPVRFNVLQAYKSGADGVHIGTYLKFTDDVKKAIEEQGINAFKLGGPVDIDKMLAEL
jgi:hypothetical protein